MAPYVQYPSNSLRSIVMRYEWYSFPDSSASVNELVFLPGLTNDFLFTSGEGAPALFSDRQYNKASLPMGALLCKIQSRTSIHCRQGTSLLRVVFYPGAISSLYRVAIDQLEEGVNDLSKGICQELFVVQRRLDQVTTLTDKISVIEAHLAQQLSQGKNNSLFYPKLNHHLLTNGYRQSVNELSSLFYICPRHFNRLLKAELGFSAQEFMSMHRIARVLKYLQQYPNCQLIEMAYEFDFSDQSHFIRHFQRFLGISPKRFQRLLNSPWQYFADTFDDLTIRNSVF